MQVTVSFDLNDTPAQLKSQLAKWNTLIAGQTANLPANTDTDEDAEEAPPAKKTKGKSKPTKTVSDDEDEEFGTKGAVDEEELEDEDAEEADESEDEDEEEGLPWETVKEAINKYGNKKPDEMKAILLSFNFKSTKELQQHKVKWEPVYRKVMAKLKATKKAK